MQKRILGGFMAVIMVVLGLPGFAQTAPDIKNYPAGKYFSMDREKMIR